VTQTRIIALRSYTSAVNDVENQGEASPRSKCVTFCIWPSTVIWSNWYKQRALSYGDASAWPHMTSALCAAVTMPWFCMHASEALCCEQTEISHSFLNRTIFSWWRNCPNCIPTPKKTDRPTQVSMHYILDFSPTFKDRCSFLFLAFFLFRVLECQDLKWFQKNSKRPVI